MFDEAATPSPTQPARPRPRQPGATVGAAADDPGDRGRPPWLSPQGDNTNLNHFVNSEGQPSRLAAPQVVLPIPAAATPGLRCVRCLGWSTARRL